MSTLPTFAYASISPELTRLIETCETRELNEWETKFVADMRVRRYQPTDKQMTVLRRIASGAPNYAAIAEAAIRALPEILPRWLPNGKFVGREYVALNPKRGDRTAGSFAVNTTNGKWADFATGDRGGDTIALAAWLFSLPQPEAARRVAAMLGMSTNEVAGG